MKKIREKNYGKRNSMKLLSIKQRITLDTALEDALSELAAGFCGRSRDVLVGRRKATVSISAVPRHPAAGSKWLVRADRWQNPLSFRSDVRRCLFD